MIKIIGAVYFGLGFINGLLEAFGNVLWNGFERLWEGMKTQKGLLIIAGVIGVCALIAGITAGWVIGSHWLSLGIPFFVLYLLMGCRNEK